MIQNSSSRIVFIKTSLTVTFDRYKRYYFDVPFLNFLFFSEKCFCVFSRWFSRCGGVCVFVLLSLSPLILARWLEE
jgi:hypothetical protein